MAYDSPAFEVRFEKELNNLVGIASTMFSRSLFFQAAKLKKVHALTIVAGTNDAAGVDIYVGTTSVAAITFGTATAGTLTHSSAIDVAIPANGYVELKGKATSATMSHTYILEYDLDENSVKS